MPEISVIIPCYNGYKYMKRCLQSFEHQSYNNFELIVVDDCSTDDSYEQLVRYKKQSLLDLSIIKNNKNAGPGESRNTGVKNARGKWISFCDCDDWYEPDFLKEMLQKLINEQANLIMCDYYYVYGSNKKIKNGKMDVFKDRPVKEEILAYAQMSLCCILAGKELFDDIYVTRLYHAEDAALIPQLIAKSNNTIIDKRAFYNYVIRVGSASEKPEKKVPLEFVQAFACIKKSIGKAYPDECEYIGINMVCYVVTFSMIKAGYKNKDIKKMIKEFKNNNPNWIHNKYFKKTPKAKKVYFYSINNGLYIINRLYVLLHRIILKCIA